MSDPERKQHAVSLCFITPDTVTPDQFAPDPVAPLPTWASLAARSEKVWRRSKMEKEEVNDVTLILPNLVFSIKMVYFKINFNFII